MDNISYHGTNTESAEMIIGPPSKLNINIGRGELGRGFYTGSSVAMAAIWAQNRYQKKGVVIQFDIPLSKFVQLKGYLIKKQIEVVDSWKALKTNQQSSTFGYGYDYVMAPFATIDCVGNQYKFESQKAEDELNAANKQIYPCE